MNNNIMTFFLFWGIWVVLPILIDGVLFVIYTVTVFTNRAFKKRSSRKYCHEELPFVSVVIPTFNEEENISSCLNFLKIQTYPHDRMEIIVVDNGSVDKTGKIVLAHKGGGDIELEGTEENGNGNGKDNEPLPQSYQVNGKIVLCGRTYDTKDFKGSLHLVTRYDKGKAKALNAGIRKTKGDIIVNIDSRSFLDPEAIGEMVKAFMERPEMGAATGNIEINWNLVHERDPIKGFVVDERGYLITKTMSLKEAFLAKSQFLEYISSFHIGRSFQDIANSMYTMSGAFSAIRRSVLAKTKLYKDKTIVEDTHLTLDIGSKSIHIGYVPNARAYLRPVYSWERLYAQRIRWNRGQVEVMGLYYPKLGKRKFGLGKAIFFPLTLLIDHTFAFPRLIWFFIFPALIMFGYHPKVIAIASLLMFGFYVFLDLLITSCCYFLSDKISRGQIRHAFYWIPLLAIYRLVLFFIRVSAYLTVLRDDPEWTVSNNPIGSIKRGHKRGRVVWQSSRLSKVYKALANSMGFMRAPIEVKGEKE